MRNVDENIRRAVKNSDTKKKNKQDNIKETKVENAKGSHDNAHTHIRVNYIIEEIEMRKAEKGKKNIGIGKKIKRV